MQRLQNKSKMNYRREMILTYFKDEKDMPSSSSTKKIYTQIAFDVK